MKFAINTFKYGLPKDSNGIYNYLTRVLPYTFDELFSRVNKYARVEDDEIATSSVAEKRRGTIGATTVVSLINQRGKERKILVRSMIMDTRESIHFLQS